MKDTGPRISIFVPQSNENPWRDFVEIHFCIKQPSGKVLVAKPVEFVEVDPMEHSGSIGPAIQACIKGDGDALLQSIMNQLWSAGVRPSDIGTPGHLAATSKHLEDMRAIAFGLLKDVEKP